MKKIILASVLALALPVLGMAATFSNVAFENGDVTISGAGNSTKNATFRLTVPAGQVVEYVEVDVLGDSLAPVETSVGGELGLQEGTHDVTLPVKLPPNTGTYSLQVKGAGIYGGMRSVNAADGVVAGPTSFSNALRVVADSNVVGGSSSSIEAIVAAILAKLGVGSTPAPSQSASCVALSAKMAGTMDNTYNESNVRLQGFLLSEGSDIPALKAGASFGYKGTQTNAAVSMYKINHGCI